MRPTGILHLGHLVGNLPHDLAWGFGDARLVVLPDRRVTENPTDCREQDKRSLHGADLPTRFNGKTDPRNPCCAIVGDSGPNVKTHF